MNLLFIIDMKRDLELSPGKEIHQAVVVNCQLMTFVLLEAVRPKETAQELHRLQCGARLLSSEWPAWWPWAGCLIESLFPCL